VVSRPASNLQKGCTRFATASDKVYQLLAHGRWFSLGTPASSTTKTGRHDIAEILLKVALKHKKSNQIKSNHTVCLICRCVDAIQFFLLINYILDKPPHKILNGTNNKSMMK